MSDFSQGFWIAILRIYALVLLVIGVGLIGGGGYLLTLGGSPYYLVCGLTVGASGVLLWRRRMAGATLYGVMLLATIAWALWESGYDGWALMPRVLAPAVLGLVLLLPGIRASLVRGSTAWSNSIVIGGTVAAIAVGVILRAVLPPAIPADPIYQMGTTAAPAVVPAQATDTADGDWRNYGNDPGGSRFSPIDQLTPANVAALEPAWTLRLGDASPRGHEVTPLKIDQTLYACTSFNDVIAIDAETGKQLWRFNANVDVKNQAVPQCRGLAYYKVPGASGACAERIYTNTVNARLIALDAHDGTPCQDFGTNGEVSLLTGMGEVTRGYYHVTSAPTLIQGKLVLGGYVADDQYWGEPSGVVRAFDAVTGKLAWAWDMGQPDRQGEPPEGESYTRSTPNAWGPMSVDETLGLVYAPTGNATPDMFGAQRRPFDEQYSSSVVALDAATGRPRWSFQTAHHDLWDYDVPAQPTLVDYPTANGVVHALLQPTKRGELFVLDRATGAPLSPVEERPVSTRGAAPDDRPSPTQPFPMGVPSFRGADLVEGDMWGITPLDQLWCRIKFREARYDGPATPPGLTSAIQMPGYIGGMDWGGVATDADRHIAIVNTNYMPIRTRLVPRSEADKLGLKPFTATESGDSDIGARQSLRTPQAGTPYGVLMGPFVSPLQVPCNQPPFGRLSAMDLSTGKLIWSEVFGTAEETGPLGVHSKLPLHLGTFNFGSAVVTRSGVFFIASTQDKHLRAYDTATGKELWKVELPADGEATPMTYLSPQSGRQFVAIAAGGERWGGSASGDYIVAYALPKKPDAAKP